MKIKSESELREIYGFPKGRAALKLMSILDSHSSNFIARSPFLLMSTIGSNGRIDCSPRGGEPGFVIPIGNGKLIIPDYKGNNRLDSLVNIMETGQAGCLFIIPGIGTVLRINGSCELSNDDDFIRMFIKETNTPKCVIVLEIKELFFHCAKAIHRSSLWDDSSKIGEDMFPSIGNMINDQLSESAS